MIKVLMRQCCFFKQKTAYEMRISDWSSDVCSSDLLQVLAFYDKWLRDSRNWAGQKMAAGSWHFARWIDLDNPESPADDLRARSEERRVGKERVRRRSSRWSTHNKKKSRRQIQMYNYEKTSEQVMTTTSTSTE